MPELTAVEAAPVAVVSPNAPETKAVAPADGTQVQTPQSKETSGADKGWLKKQAELRREELRVRSEKEAVRTQAKELSAMAEAREMVKRGENPFKAIEQAFGIKQKDLLQWQMTNGGASPEVELTARLEALETSIREKEEYAAQIEQEKLAESEKAELSGWEKETLEGLSKDPKYVSMAALGGHVAVVEELKRMDKAGEIDGDTDLDALVAQVADKINQDYTTRLPQEIDRVLAVPEIRAMIEAKLKSEATKTDPKTDEKPKSEGKFAEFGHGKKPATPVTNTISSSMAGSAKPVQAKSRAEVLARLAAKAEERLSKIS